MEGIVILLILFLIVAMLTAVIYPFISSSRQAEIKRHIKTLEARTRSLEKQITELEYQAPRAEEAKPTTPPAVEEADDAGAVAPASEPEAEPPSLSQAPPPPPQPISAEKPIEAPASPGRYAIPPAERSTRAPAPAADRTPAPPQPATPSSLSKIPWRRILEAMQLLPPEQSAEDNTEVRLAVWWTTRIGVILAVIASVFLGVYVSKDSPVLRLLALGTTSVVVVLVGLWLEKRYRAFGRIVASGGLGMCFVTAFAASAFETTRVIDSAAVGVIVQLLAIAGTIAWSLWKDDAAVGTMALICGYIACAFSHNHDLAHFVIGGLLMLAAAGCALLILRRWPAPAIIALGASWAGFFLLTVLHWRIESTTDQPAALAALACFVALALIFQISGVVFRHHHPKLATSRRLRIGSIVNSSLAVVTLYFAGRLVYPEHLATFYLTFAVLIFGFAAWHQRPGKSHDEGLAQTFFLKSMALLALFLVAQFSGPVRWLSLSLQTATLVYTWKRHRNDWLLLATGVAFAVTIGWLARDLLHIDWLDDWSAFGVRNVVGAISLLVLGAALAWQSDIFQKDSDDVPKTNRSTVRIAQCGGAILIAGVAIGLANQGSLFFRDAPVARIGYLTIVGIFLLLPLLRWQSLTSVISGGGVLIAASLLYQAIPRDAASSTSGLVLGQCLVVLAWLAAEIVWRKWPRQWTGGEIPRALAYGIGLATLTATLIHMHDAMEWLPAVPILVLMTFAAIIALTLVLHARPFAESTSQTSSAAPARWIVSAIAGLALLFVGTRLLAFNSTNSCWLAFASLPIFATIYRSRDAIPTAAGGIPLTFSWIAFVALAFSRHPEWQAHLIATLGIIAVNFTIASCLSRAASTAQSLAANIFERLLHIASLILAFVFLNEHFDSPTTCAASVGLAIASMLGARFLPFRQLAVVSIVPAILAAISYVFHHGWKPHPQPAISWWLTLAAVPAAFFVWEIFLRRTGRLSAEQAPFTGEFTTFIPALLGVASLVFVRGAIADPWQPVGYAALGLAGLILWRFANFSYHREWPALPMLLTAASVFFTIQSDASDFDSLNAARISCILAIAGVLTYGLLLTARRAHSPARSLVPAAVGSALAFLLFAGSGLGFEKLATVCWGITAIVVFVAGLAGGLRNYRLVGLVGLGLCLIRMFLVDIDDTLYRIIAFFVIALVLLLIGYLYNRFRHLIEVFDEQVEVGAEEEQRVEAVEKNSD